MRARWLDEDFRQRLNRAYDWFEKKITLDLWKHMEALYWQLN
jgi:hypothetical protein